MINGYVSQLIRTLERTDLKTDNKEGKGKRSVDGLFIVSLQKCSSDGISRGRLSHQESKMDDASWRHQLASSSDALVFADRSIFKEVIMPGKGTVVASHHRFLSGQRGRH